MPTPLQLYRRLEADLARLIPSQHKFNPEFNLRLERVAHFLNLLDNPQEAFPTIHVGGTSGKGSTATLISTMLSSAGYRTGLHLSPHLQVLNERHQINNQYAPIQKLVDVYETLKPAIADMKQAYPHGAPTYFEAQFALALCYFREQKVDIAVIEVGLGGLLDATNVLSSEIAVLTKVGLDHTTVLGNSIDAIAKHKVGIIKPHQTVICGWSQSSAQQIVQSTCAQHHATLYLQGIDFEISATAVDGPGFDLQTPFSSYTDLRLSLHGLFQNENAAAAIVAVEALTHRITKISVAESHIRDGLLKASIPGRMEQVQSAPKVMLDGAHNPDKMEAAAEALLPFSSHRRIVVLSLKRDKAIDSVLRTALQDTDILVVTAFYVKGLWEPIPPEKLAEVAQSMFPHLAIHTIDDPLEATKFALQLAHPEDFIWITGSLYLVGDVRELWFPLEQLIAGDFP